MSNRHVLWDADEKQEQYRHDYEIELANLDGLLADTPALLASIDRLVAALSGTA